jgi:hypothetical protein
VSDGLSPGKVVVFLGPTVAAAEAQSVLPHADYRPPVSQGDIFSMLGADGPDAIGIVDGLFYQDLPVWHKEILHALASGVAVYGASSMGALRAAECAPFGMVGVGAIFEAYASGDLADDDEVAVAHGGPETGWHSHTEPMVNLRATMHRAVNERRIAPALSERFLSFAKQLWFPERTRQLLMERADAWAESEEDAAAVRRAVEADYVDQKRLDALKLLEVLRDRPMATATEPRTAPRLEVSRCHMFDAFAERDRKVERSGTTLRLEEIARYVALHDPDYSRVYDRALDRMLVNELAVSRGIDPTPDQVADELNRIRARLQIRDDDSLARWLADNQVDEAWLQAHAKREARARRLRDWARVRAGKRLLVRPVLDELRLENRYVAAADEAAEHHKMRQTAGEDAGSSRPEVGGSANPAVGAADLVRDQIRSGGWRPDVPVDRFADEAGFAGVADLLAELVAARAVRRRAQSQMATLSSIFGEDPNVETAPADHRPVVSGPPRLTTTTDGMTT